MNEILPGDLPTTFRWRLAGGVPPALALALPLGEAVRAAVMRAGNRMGLPHLPDALHHAGPGGLHDHAHWLPEDRDGDGRIDHVLVHAQAGLSTAMVSAFVAASTVWLTPGTTWMLQPVWLGNLRDSAEWGPARQWEAATAYVTPRWRTDRGRDKPGSDPEAQLRRELALRGMPVPVEIAWAVGVNSGTVVVASADFVVRTKCRRPPGDAWKGAPRITFAVPVAGPLAFGFGAHFGLGRLRPVSE